MYEKRKPDFLKRLRENNNIHSNDISDIIEQLTDGASSEELALEYRIDEVDMERIINQFGFNQPDEEPVIDDDDDI